MGAFKSLLVSMNNYFSVSFLVRIFYNFIILMLWEKHLLLNGNFIHFFFIFIILFAVSRDLKAIFKFVLSCYGSSQKQTNKRDLSSNYKHSFFGFRSLTFFRVPPYKLKDQGYSQSIGSQKATKFRHLITRTFVHYRQETPL